MEQSTTREKGRIAKGKHYFKVAEGIWGLTDLLVNVYVIENKENNSWVLVDAGLKSTYPKIKRMVAELFGEDARPEAILLTHGHFDHVGSLDKLLTDWNVPVYAHELELPYLKGKSAYPPADSSVGGGLMSLLADFYSAEPIDLGNAVHALPAAGLPFLPDWDYIHTPGHTAGHVSFWREKDKVLVVGDAFVTTKQESAISILLQKKIISGPPKYFTSNWLKAEDSVDQLAALLPEVVATGHGKPMYGVDMQQELLELAYYFEEKALPKTGRYVVTPAITNSEGIVSLPADVSDPFRTALTIGAMAAVVGLGYALFSKYKLKNSYQLDPAS